MKSILTRIRFEDLVINAKALRPSAKNFSLHSTVYQEYGIQSKVTIRNYTI